MNLKKSLLGYYNYTVILTYISLFFGIMGICVSINNQYTIAIICLMFAGLCDMFDGKIAATKRRNFMEKGFGIQIDSLCDLVNFGVFPALLVYQMSNGNLIMIIIICLYVLAALIRLAYFNVSEEVRQETQSGKRELYEGLPVTAMALILPGLYVVQRFVPSESALLLAVGICLAGLAFLLPFKIGKPEFKGKAIILGLGVAEMLAMCLVVIPMD